MTITPIILDRLAGALSRHGVRMKRMKLLQTVAEAFGHRNVHNFEASGDDGDHPPEARYMGRTRVANVGWMHFFQDPDGTVFAVDQDRFDAQEGRAADWILNPIGGLLDVSALRSAQRPAGEASAPARVLWEEDATSHPVVTNLCREIDALPPGGYGPFDPEVPAYMTSGCCEVARVTQEDLDALGLPYGSFDDAFYPLTEEEARYIAEDLIDSKDGMHGALIGYAVLYRGAKHLMPSVEIAFATERDKGETYPPRDEVLADAAAYAERILPKLQGMGGNVLIDVDHDDRIIVQLLVPIEAAMAVGDFAAWKGHLAWLITDPDLPSLRDGRYPMRHEGRNYAVEVDWIGEGEDGDYQPNDPNDAPLLRYDTQRRVDGGWEDVDDGSYCTQVPAWCDPKYARALARSIATHLEVEGGSNPKRLMEGMSWFDLDTVKIAWAAQHDEATSGTVVLDAALNAEDLVEFVQAQAAARQRGHDADDTYVAHVTYGDPDRGTSIDLRRRADGSVRCEVYVDLAGTDVFEGRDMAAVRAWLKTLGSDIENADGPSQPAHALAPQWEDDEDPEGGVRWMLVPADESEEDWFMETSSAAPFEHRFVKIDEMSV